MKKRKIIIDTDCGSDDAVAIAMALNDPNYEIMMITTVGGNVNMYQATTNTLTTLEYADTYYPDVYMGSSEMLIKPLVGSSDTHGSDGMGDLGYKPERLQCKEGNGVLKLLEAMRNSEDKEIDIITLGPLTNIALALKLDKKAMLKANKVVVMGSAGLGTGNVSPVAEFNIWQDGEAAKIVLDAGFENLYFVGWDACLDDSMLTPTEIDTIRKSGKLGEFCIECNRVLMELNKRRFGDYYLDMADPSAMAAALYPECIDTCDKYYCQVDISNGPSYGALIVDYYRFSGKQPNAYIVSKLKPDLYKEYIYKTLRVK